MSDIPKKVIPHIGSKKNRLTILEFVRKKKYVYKHRIDTFYVVKVKCDCGKYKEVLLESILTGKTRSCGCLVSINNHYKIKKKMDFKLVTVCNRFPTESYYCLTEFIKSLQGVDPLVLGTKPNEYTGLGDKPKLLYKAIKNGLVKNKYIVFCDCWDLVFAVHPNAMVSDYVNCFQSPLVISSEKNCFPADLKEQYDQLPFTSSYRYLNSGMILGETEAMLSVLESMDLANVPDDYRMEDGNNFHVNDQFLYQQMFLKQPVKIELDYEQILCNTLHEVTIDELDFSKEFILNKETNYEPCSFHFNGGAKTNGLREPILKHLNLL